MQYLQLLINTLYKNLLINNEVLLIKVAIENKLKKPHILLSKLKYNNEWKFISYYLRGLNFAKLRIVIFHGTSFDLVLLCKMPFFGK